MSVLSAYNPLKTIWLPGAEVTQPKGIIVVVGPNSSGKTLFLRDIEKYLLTGTHGFVVCQAIAPQRPANYQGMIDELLAKNYLQPAPGQPQHYRTYVPFMMQRAPNEQNARPIFPLQSLQKGYDEFVSERGGNNPKWFGAIGITLVAPLSLDMRRQVCNRINSFDYKTGTPDYPVQGLYLNSEAQEKLAEETGNVFGNAVWLDISEQGALNSEHPARRSARPTARRSTHWRPANTALSKARGMAIGLTSEHVSPCCWGFGLSHSLMSRNFASTRPKPTTLGDSSESTPRTTMPLSSPRTAAMSFGASWKPGIGSRSYD